MKNNNIKNDRNNNNNNNRVEGLGSKSQANLYRAFWFG